jgi:acyl-CoA thioester hydrolase
LSCRFVWGESKTFRISQESRRVDGAVAAELDTVARLPDRQTRGLVPDPGGVLRSLATAP